MVGNNQRLKSADDCESSHRYPLAFDCAYVVPVVDLNSRLWPYQNYAC
jgi:hypothetical protein